MRHGHGWPILVAQGRAAIRTLASICSWSWLMHSAASVFSAAMVLRSCVTMRRSSAWPWEERGWAGQGEDASAVVA